MFGELEAENLGPKYSKSLIKIPLLWDSRTSYYNPVGLVQFLPAQILLTYNTFLGFTELLPIYRFTEKFLNIYRQKIFVELFTELMPSD